MPTDEPDAIDMRILGELQKSAKLTNLELSARVHLSPSPCLARVRRLERTGLISRYVTLLDAGRLGLGISVIIQIRLEKQIERALEVFEAAMQRYPEVMECYLMSGDSDYLIRVVVRDVPSLQRFIVDELSKIPGVANIRSSFALKQVKYKTALPLPEPPMRGSRQRKRRRAASAVRTR
ncbi:MAG TPA: Lrp/AsnC family transcriptional regulator [Steroidobacteraceae bacterium]|jgi:Lrp/AsnC family leucine-responsive transcriptional regulator